MVILMTSLAQWHAVGFEWKVMGSIPVTGHFRMFKFLILLGSGQMGGFGRS